MRPLRVALVGGGAVSEIVVERAYAALSDLVEVVAVVDPRAERAEPLARVLGARPYNALTDVLTAEDVAAVDVRVPHPAHAEVTLAALDAGRHVLVEKPIATSVQDARAMVKAAAATDAVLSVAENYTFFEPVRVAARLLEQGAIGKLLTVRTHRVAEVTGVWARDGWRSDADRSGGILLDQGCHFANLLRRTVGEITHVHAYTSVRAPGWSAEDSAVVNCRFASGLIAQQFYCWATATPEIGAECYFYGTDGSIEVRVTYDAPGGGVVLFDRDHAEGQWELEGGDYFDSFRPTLEDWVRACLGEHPPAMPGEEGLRDLEVVMAGYRSAASGHEELVGHG